jgi:hypothetical protein
LSFIVAVPPTVERIVFAKGNSNQVAAGWARSWSGGFNEIIGRNTSLRVERMNHEIAGTLRDEELMRLRTSSYADLLKYIDKPVSTLLNGPDSEKYQIESQAFWDTKKGGNIRVMVSVDDG